MEYPFPRIEHIDQILPAIKGRDEFIVADKGDYKVINYHVQFADTFPPVVIDADPYDQVNGVWLDYDYNAALRRECRGIIFDRNGKIIRRPLQKFFNVGEKEEVQVGNFDLFNTPHHILEKLDGSMIAVFAPTPGNLIFGTKMGHTEVSIPAQQYAFDNPGYVPFAQEFINEGWTPIFEWTSRKQRIVLDYPEDNLIMIAARHMITGEYMSYDDMLYNCDVYDIPLVEHRDFSGKDIHQVLSLTRDLIDEEGFVIRFHNGHQVKAKSDWYIAIHKAKEAILWDRHIVNMILENTLDDVKANLPDEDRERLMVFEEQFEQAVRLKVRHLFQVVEKYKTDMNVDRKTFALEYAKHFDPYTKAAIFSLWDDNSSPRAYELVLSTISKYLTSNSRYDGLRDAWFPEVKFN